MSDEFEKKLDFDSDTFEEMKKGYEFRPPAPDR